MVQSSTSRSKRLHGSQMYPSFRPVSSSRDSSTSLRSNFQPSWMERRRHRIECLFGYGSLINRDSRRASRNDCHDCAVPVWLSTEFGYTRAWNFRSPTGFTALGLRKVTQSFQNNLELAEVTSSRTDGMIGILFPMFVSFCDLACGNPAVWSPVDERERGYTRIEVDVSRYLSYWEDGSVGTVGDVMGLKERLLRALHSTSLPHDLILTDLDLVVWTYVPNVELDRPPDQEHPICQSYVDVVLSGCLEFGVGMAEEFIKTTHGWSNCFLNDVPLSRRPWLNRPKNYREIDSILEKHKEWSRIHERRHPEQFAADFLTGFQGLWGVPRRNDKFTGREAELGALKDMLEAGSHAQADRATDTAAGISQVEVVGLGGVGKSQLCAEYCYRWYPTKYRVVAWFRAENPVVLASDMRKFAFDLVIPGAAVSLGPISPTVSADRQDGSNLSTNVVEAVKARFYRSSAPWLIVLDNVQQLNNVTAFLPHGGMGHVLVSSRRLSDHSSVNHSPTSVPRVLSLHCFRSHDAVRFFEATLGSRSNSKSGSISDERGTGTHFRRIGTQHGLSVEGRLYSEISERLGCLPLALSMAAAYMRQCDVSPSEYLEKFGRHKGLLHPARTGVDNSSLGVTGSLSLSLTCIASENQLARQVLDSLCFMAPDALTKKVVGQIVVYLQSQAVDYLPSKSSNLVTSDTEVGSANTQTREWSSGISLVAALVFLVALLICSLIEVSTPGSSRFTSLLMLVLSSLSTGLLLSNVARNISGQSRTPASKGKRSMDYPSRSRADPELEADKVWFLLKTFSVLVTRDTWSSDVPEHNFQEQDLHQTPARSGSMHRLLQQVLISAQSPAEASRSLILAARAVTDLWWAHFDNSRSETENNGERWTKSAGDHVEHMKAVAYHLSTLQISYPEITRALIAGAEYTSIFLSRFEEARNLLHLALTMINFTPSSGKSSTNKRGIRAWLTPDQGTERKPGEIDASERTQIEVDCCHELGKVYRYCGMLALSEQYLLRAFNVRCRQVGLPSEADEAIYVDDCSVGIASSLYELGVLYIKKNEYRMAEKYLRRALQALPCLVSDGKGGKARDIWGVKARAIASAVYHQLATIACSVRPARLTEARALLMSALTTDTSLGARGPTLLLLGRLSVRQGRLEEAKAHLLEALELMQRTHAQDNINVAGVCHQLGVVYRCRGDQVQAQHYHNRALDIRRSVGASPLEITWSLSELSRVEQCKGNLVAAMNYLLESRELLTQTKKEQMTDNIEDDAKEHERKRKKALLHTLFALRNIATSLRQATEAHAFRMEAAKLAKEVAQDDMANRKRLEVDHIRQRREQAEQHSQLSAYDDDQRENDDEDDEVEEVQVTARQRKGSEENDNREQFRDIVRVRDLIRKRALITLKQEKKKKHQGSAGHLTWEDSNAAQELAEYLALHHSLCLESQVSGPISRAAQRLLAVSFSILSSLFPTECEKLQPLHTEQEGSLSNDPDRVEEQSKRVLEACDSLRTALNNAGLTIADSVFGQETR